LRLARPEEADRVAELAETTGGPLDEYMYGAIERGTASTALLKALDSGKDAYWRRRRPRPLGWIAVRGHRLFARESGGGPVDPGV
jgi:hypothetical protein